MTPSGGGGMAPTLALRIAPDLPRWWASIIQQTSESGEPGMYIASASYVPAVVALTGDAGRQNIPVTKNGCLTKCYERTVFCRSHMTDWHHMSL